MPAGKQPTNGAILEHVKCSAREETHSSGMTVHKHKQHRRAMTLLSFPEPVSGLHQTKDEPDHDFAIFKPIFIHVIE